jgi:hypothetical protein
VWRKSVFDIYFTEFGAVLTTVLPVLFKYCYKYCYSDSRKLWAVMKAGGFGALISDSIHHFFRNACTKSGSLRFSQFSGCRLILSVYTLMSFDLPFVRLFGVRKCCCYSYLFPVHFPIVDDDVLFAPSYGIYTSLLVSFARICNNVSDFNDRNPVTTENILFHRQYTCTTSKTN